MFRPLFVSLLVAPLVWAGEITPVFQNGTEGYHTFRIPSLVTTRNGDLLAFAEARKKGGGDSGDIDLVQRRSSDGGKTWGKLQVVWDDEGNTCGNPCIVEDEASATLHLLLTWNSGSESESAIRKGTAPLGRRPFHSVSTDFGATWSKPRDITAQADKPEWGWYATGPGRGIQLQLGPHKGRLIIPANHSRADGTYDAHALLSDDGGQTWKLSAPLGDGANESCVAELPRGEVLFNTRMQTHGKGLRGTARSTNGGETWSALEHDGNLPCPTCEGSMLRWSFGRGPTRSILLFCNPVGPGRTNITLRASLDDGASWPHALLLHAEKGPGYTALTKVNNHTIGVLHETTSGVGFQPVALKSLLESPAK